VSASSTNVSTSCSSRVADMRWVVPRLPRADTQPGWAPAAHVALIGLAGWYHPGGWLADGWQMVGGWCGVVAPEAEKTEKITINLGLVDLGQIDLLVQEGFYANRTDFIRTAIRTQLGSRSSAVDQTVARRTLTLGTQHFSRRDLEAIREAGEMVDIRVLGLATIADDVSPKLALATIASVEVLGAFRASAAVKAVLAPRTA
jgi:Arc/MetJ-type ribon-helix-helix transcriptional regulator